MFALFVRDLLGFCACKFPAESDKSGTFPPTAPCMTHKIWNMKNYFILPKGGSRLEKLDNSKCVVSIQYQLYFGNDNLENMIYV